MFTVKIIIEEKQEETFIDRKLTEQELATFRTIEEAKSFVESIVNEF